MKKLFCILSAVLLWSLATAGEKHQGYHLTLTIEGNEDSVMYLGNYYAGSTYAIDTAQRNKKGQFVFDKKDRTLLPGLYFFSSPGGNYVEFIVYHETPNFVFTTQEKGWTRYMTVKGSKENDIFFAYQEANYQTHDKIDALKAQGMTGDTLKEAQHRLLQQLDSVKEAIIAQHPHSMMALMMNATREVAVPKEDKEGNKLSEADRYYYYMDHYFDHMALDDDALVRTPDVIFHRPLNDYFDRYLKGAKAEQICDYIDSLIEKSRTSKEVFKYLVHFITEKYLQTNIMSYDAIYVHLVKKYFATELNYWSAPSVIDEQMKRANTWERLLIGKTAPDLMLHDADGTWHTLSGLRHKYTLLVFWSPTCGHCKTIIPELYEKFMLYKDTFDITAFAVLSEPDETTHEKWVEFINAHNMKDPRWLNIDGSEANIDWHEVYDIITTPQIYLVDKEKKIIAKKLNAATFESIIKILEDTKD